MLDLQRRVDLPAPPDILVYRDDEQPRGFYAFPPHPRITRDASSRYDMRLVVYGQRDGGRFIPNGGMLAITFGLELTSDEQSALQESLTAFLAAESPTKTPLQPEMLTAEWLDGATELRLEPGGVAAGKPSLYAGNRCVFSVNIGAGEIGAFLDAWEGGLENAGIAFAMRVRTRAGAAPLAFSGRVMPADATPSDHVTRVEL